VCRRKFVRYALRGLGWTDMYDLPPYVNQWALICLETLSRRLSDACMMFVFDVLSSKAGSPNLFSLVNVVAPRYRTRGGDFSRIDFHRTNYGVNEPLNDTVRHRFNKVAGLFSFVKLSIFLNLRWCDLVRPFTLCWIILYALP
jgi:hypothetical protein